MFTYLSSYKVLICREHQHAVYSLDEHLKRHHQLPVAKRRELLAAYQGLSLSLPNHVVLPGPDSAPIQELGPAQNAYLCCQLVQQQHQQQRQQHGSQRCSYISTSRLWMRKHVNQQHSINLSRWPAASAAATDAGHAAQLWKPVKTQTFF